MWSEFIKRLNRSVTITTRKKCVYRGVWVCILLCVCILLFLSVHDLFSSSSFLTQGKQNASACRNLLFFSFSSLSTRFETEVSVVSLCRPSCSALLKPSNVHVDTQTLLSLHYSEMSDFTASLMFLTFLTFKVSLKSAHCHTLSMSPHCIRS